MASSDLLTLRSSIARGKLECDRLNLSDQEISDIKFDGFSSQPSQMLMLRQSKLSGSTLKRWSITLGNLTGSDFQATTFEDCQFTSTQFQGSDFFGAAFKDCVFAACYMSEAFFAHAKFESCLIMQTTMRDSVIFSAKFINTNIDGITFDGFENATRKATAEIPPQLLAKASDLGAHQNRIDQASLDSTLKLLATRRNIRPSLDGKFHDDGESYADREAKHFSSPAAIESFLRSTSLTKDEIRSFVQKYRAISEAKSFFISYSFKDSVVAEQLADRLGRRGCTVWFAPSNMQAGATIAQQLHGGLYEADVLLVLVSESSIGSDWVKREILEFYRFQKQHPERRLCPLRLDNAWSAGLDLGSDGDAVEASKWFRAHFAPDFSQWRDPISFSAVFDQVARDLDAMPSSKLSDLGDIDKSEFRTDHQGPKGSSAELHYTRDPVDVGSDLVASWRQARQELKRDRSDRNRETEASSARLLASFLRQAQSHPSGLLVASLTIQECPNVPELSLSPELVKALQYYVDFATQAMAKEKPKKTRWWPFGKQ